MNADAKAFRASTVQTVKARMQAPNYRILLQADTFSEDTDLPQVVFWRDMMLLGSVLLPEEPAGDDAVVPPFYLDDPAVRTIIQTELDMPLRLFVRGVHVASWAFHLALPGAPRGTSHIPRRFFATSTMGAFGYEPIAVPWQADKDAIDSMVAVDATVMPDFEDVTDRMRYAALGL